jgi:hypothetical protein
MLGAFRDYKPMWVFGGISAVFMVLAILCGSFVMIHYFRTGAFFPYVFIAFTAAGMGFIALVCYITAMLAGMINRIRILQDEQLFLLRKNEYEKIIDKSDRDFK